MGCVTSSASKYVMSPDVDSPMYPPSWLGVALPSIIPPGKAAPVNASSCLQSRLLHHPHATDLTNDFVTSKILGRGKFGEVLLIKSKDDDKVS